VKLASFTWKVYSCSQWRYVA